MFDILNKSVFGAQTNSSIVPQLFTEVAMTHTSTDSASSTDFYSHIASELAFIRSEGLYKAERIITGPQSAHIPTRTADGGQRAGGQYVAVPAAAV